MKNTIEAPFKKYLNEISSLLSKAEDCQKLIKDYDELPDLDFYKRLKELKLNTELKIEDYVKIVSIMNNKKYKGPVTIKTNMKAKVREETGRGKDKESYQVDRPVRLQVVYTDVLDLNHKYTFDEIDNLQSLGKIFVFKREVMWNEYYAGDGGYCPYYQTSNIDGTIFYRFEESLEINNLAGEYFKYTLEYMRKKYSKEKLDSIFNNLISLSRAEMNIMSTMQTQYDEKGFQKRIDKLTNK